MAGNPDIHVLLTRPRRQAQVYAAELQGKFGPRAGVILSPLLEIVPVDSAIDLEGISHILFTSINGVEHFANRSSRRDIACLCVGEKTAAAARALGFEAEAAAGRAEDLISLAAKRAQGAAESLYVRGRHAAGDIAAALRDQGCGVREVIVYDQVAQSLSVDAINVLRGSNPVIVPLFSQRTAARFMQEVGSVDCPNTTLICLSRNIAGVVDAEKFKELRVVANPTANDVTQEIATMI